MISGASSGQTIIRKIIALSGLLVIVIVVNAVYSMFHESGHLSRQVADHLNNKLEIAWSIQENEMDKLRMISASFKEQSQKFADFLDYDKIVPITMMLKNITYIYSDELDFIFLFDEYGELLTSNIGGSEMEVPEIYAPLISDTRERVGMEEVPRDIFQGPFAEFLPPADSGRIVAFKSLLHILHDSGDIYCHVVLIKLVNGNGKLIRKMAERCGARVVYYDREGHSVITDFSDPRVPPAPEGKMVSHQGKSFFTEWKGIPDHSGQIVGKLLVAIDSQPFSDVRKGLMLSRLLPFFASIGISVALLSLMKVRVFDRIRELIAVQRTVAEGKGDLSVRLELPPKAASQRLDEVEQMGADFNLMMDKLEGTHNQLAMALADVSKANAYIMESLEYAKGIQNSMLPNPEEARAFLPEHFVIWMPRDVVSGDIFLMEPLDGGFAVAVVDCTGHGVPGAFLTMIASAGLRKIIREDDTREPARMLKALNAVVKTALHQDTSYAVSDDGMDVGLCIVNTEANILTFSGARIPLCYSENGRIEVIKGDRQSIGYKQSRRANIDFEFHNHRMSIEKDMCFYMASDGFEDQMGPDQKRQGQMRCFGRRRFLSLLEENCDLPLEEQRDRLLEAFEAYRKNYERQDDVTVMGFRA